jgi:pyruvate formate lyase activating enzyme
MKLLGKAARYWSKAPTNIDPKRIQCTLCPKMCRVGVGDFGFCGLRFNKSGILFTLADGHHTGFCLDPIEKKPLYHYLPGSLTLSLGNFGCNLDCAHCQNSEISQLMRGKAAPEQTNPSELLESLKNSDTPSVSFTYNEPLIAPEFLMECCEYLQPNAPEKKIILVSSGFVNPKAAKEIFPHIHAANIDLKAFTESFYQNTCKGSLKAVLKSLQIIRQTNCWLEITTLIIPGLNDSTDEIKKMCHWIRSELGKDTPLHLTAFYPQNRMSHLPPTPAETLIQLRETALEAGLSYVYTGNIYHPQGTSTYCPSCGKEIISRNGYFIELKGINSGYCSHCQYRIKGFFEF